MAVPDFQSIMLPLLRLCADGQGHTLAESYGVLGGHFHLTEEERRELLPSGRQTRFENRVQWAKSYLTKARLLKMIGRAAFQITDRGRELLGRDPNAITIKTLREYEEFRQFRARKSPEGQGEAKPSTAQTPHEILESCYQTLRQALADELLERVGAQPPSFFEQVVVDLLLGMGYGGSRRDAGEAIGRSGDHGVDGVIKEDRLGLDTVYVQAKRWSDTVGRPVVQAFAGSLMGLKARKGVLITTSTFSQEAIEFAKTIQERTIVLIDGERLAQLMIDHDIGVSEVDRYLVKQVDTDYFDF